MTSGSTRSGKINKEKKKEKEKKEGGLGCCCFSRRRLLPAARCGVRVERCWPAGPKSVWPVCGCFLFSFNLFRI
jgi:hypothetical protein